jgi:hypothetical protein
MRSLLRPICARLWRRPESVTTRTFIFSNRRSNIIPTYISLVQFTDKGIQAAKETTQRVAEWAAKVQSME